MTDYRLDRTIVRIVDLALNGGEFWVETYFGMNYLQCRATRLGRPYTIFRWQKQYHIKGRKIDAQQAIDIVRSQWDKRVV